MFNYCYGYHYVNHHTFGLVGVTPPNNLAAGLQQNTEAADVYGLKFSPLPVLISAPSFPCREKSSYKLHFLCTWRSNCHPTHLSLSVSNRLPYTQYFGGVSSLSKEQYLKINGFPNNYWGWGGEDDDIFNRSDNF